VVRLATHLDDQQVHADMPLLLKLLMGSDPSVGMQQTDGTMKTEAAHATKMPYGGVTFSFTSRMVSDSPVK